MTFRQEAKEATRDIIDELGEPFLYTPPGGSQIELNGIYEDEFVEQENSAGYMPTMSVFSSDSNFDNGGVFVVDGESFRIIATEPDGDGMTKCLLRSVDD